MIINNSLLQQYFSNTYWYNKYKARGVQDGGDFVDNQALDLKQTVT